jgi:hypothetical protein
MRGLNKVAFVLCSTIVEAFLWGASAKDQHSIIELAPYKYCSDWNQCNKDTDYFNGHQQEMAVFPDTDHFQVNKSWGEWAGKKSSAGDQIVGFYDSSATEFTRAEVFKEFLQSRKGDELICRAISSFYDDGNESSDCSSISLNRKKTIEYMVIKKDTVAGSYELDVIGKSADLALKVPDWVERHKLYVAFGFDANLSPQVLVVDFESMLRTTKDLLPEQDDKYEYISLSHESELETFQGIIRQKIYNYVTKAAQIAPTSESKR